MPCYAVLCQARKLNSGEMLGANVKNNAKEFEKLKAHSYVYR
jgi:hypothetical protein